MDVEVIRDSSNRLRQAVQLYDSTHASKLREEVVLYNEGKAVRIRNGEKESITDAAQLDEWFLNSFMLGGQGYERGQFRTKLKGTATVEGVACYEFRVNLTQGYGHY